MAIVSVKPGIAPIMAPQNTPIKAQKKFSQAKTRSRAPIISSSIVFSDTFAY